MAALALIWKGKGTSGVAAGCAAWDYSDFEPRPRDWGIETDGRCREREKRKEERERKKK